jgi:hypothetical protein
MLLAISTSGLWRVLWWSLIGAGIVAGYAGLLRAVGVDWVKIRWSALAAYGVAYVWWFFAKGVIIDRVSVLWSFAIFLALASLGRPLREWARMAGDLGIFVVMWLAYDESRGLADGLGMPIQVESVRNIDRFLFFGTDPVVWLQERFYRGPNNVQWYDVIGSCVYYSHFIVPPIVIAVLWLRNRNQWVRYMRRFGTLLFVACVMFVLLPTAPPWMAAGGTNRVGLELDALPPLSRPTGNGWRLGQPGCCDAIAALSFCSVRRRVLLAPDQQPVRPGRDSALPIGHGRGPRVLRRALLHRCHRWLARRRGLVPPVEPHRSPPRSAIRERTHWPRRRQSHLISFRRQHRAGQRDDSLTSAGAPSTD